MNHGSTKNRTIEVLSGTALTGCVQKVETTAKRQGCPGWLQQSAQWAFCLGTGFRAVFSEDEPSSSALGGTSGQVWRAQTECGAHCMVAFGGALVEGEALFHLAFSTSKGLLGDMGRGRPTA